MLTIWLLQVVVVDYIEELLTKALPLERGQDEHLREFCAIFLGMLGGLSNRRESCQVTCLLFINDEVVPEARNVDLGRSINKEEEQGLQIVLVLREVFAAISIALTLVDGYLVYIVGARVSFDLTHLLAELVELFLDSQHFLCEVSRVRIYNSVDVTQFLFNILNIAGSRGRCLLIVCYAYEGSKVFGTQAELDFETFIATNLLVVTENLMAVFGQKELVGSAAIQVYHLECDSLEGVHNKVTNLLLGHLLFLLGLAKKSAVHRSLHYP